MELWCKGIQAQNIEKAFTKLDNILKACGGTFKDSCVRTWIYLKDIENDYQQMVKGRKEAFDKYGLTNYISSTGVQLFDTPDVNVVLDAYSIIGLAPDKIKYLKAPGMLCAAVDYGVTFERGVRIASDNQYEYIISGTASIGKTGETLHTGDEYGQLEQTTRNIEALLKDGGATLEDVVRVRVYLVNKDNIDSITEYVSLSFPKANIDVCMAKLCRKDLLVEIECDAIVTYEQHIINSLKKLTINLDPYVRFCLTDVLPDNLCQDIINLPIEPPISGKMDGTRDTYNKQRTFITPETRKQYPVLDILAKTFQSSEVAKQLEETCGISAKDKYLRIEYIQDLDGMWLEPHRDIKDKVFSMVLYLCTGSEAKNWGTDIYDKNKKWFGRSEPKFNSAVIFKSGENTWHGFEPRTIVGVRRLLEINYVQNWKDREQLAFPDQPILRR